MAKEMVRSAILFIGNFFAILQGGGTLIQSWLPFNNKEVRLQPIAQYTTCRPSMSMGLVKCTLNPLARQLILQRVPSG